MIRGIMRLVMGEILRFFVAGVTEGSGAYAGAWRV